MLTVIVKHLAKEAVTVQQAAEQSMEQVCWSPGLQLDGTCDQVMYKVA